jgi:DNA topoisomerase-1
MTSRTELLQDEYLRREGEKVGEFRFLYPDGTELRDEVQLARIHRLAVPPAYRDVYVSPDPDAELQAFGRDAAGRLQYRYHPDFLQAGASRKWQRLARFARELPGMRDRTGADLRSSGLPRRKVMALMTRLLYIAHFRVGSEEYAAKNRTYGLSTLEKKHVSVAGSTVTFDFKGKHGIWQHKAATDRTIATNVQKLLDLPGRRLWKAEEDGRICPIRSGDLNRYIREVMGPFTAKDFRTWGGTLLAAEYLAEVGLQDGERAARRVVVDCVKHVAEDLGNTPAVVRGHYICPVIFDRYLDGRLLDDYEPRTSRERASAIEGLSRSEVALARMLDEEFGRGRRRRRSEVAQAAD